MLSLLAYCLVAAAQSPLIDANPSFAEAPLHHRRALIVGISDYSQCGDVWPSPLSGDDDAKLMKSALMQYMGFDRKDIYLLEGHVTREETVQAFRSWLSMPGGKPADPKDVLVFHFSGHGDKFPIRAGVATTSTAGFETALVFSDTQGHDPSHMITNADLEDLLKEVDPRVSLTMTLDACHTGSAATRGGIRFRGPLRAATEPVPVAQTPSEAPSADDKESGLFSGAKARNDVILSACRSDESAQDLGPGRGGLFTNGLVTAMGRMLGTTGARTNLSYRELFWQTLNAMTACKGGDGIPQHPVPQGNLDRLVFGDGSMSYAGYYPTLYDAHNGQLRVEGGVLMGLRYGSKLDLYRPGQTPSSGVPPIGKVVVSKCDAAEATVQPDASADTSAWGGLWAFPEGTFGDDGLVSLYLDSDIDADDRSAIQSAVGQEEHALRLATSKDAADLLLFKDDGQLTLENRQGTNIGEFSDDDVGRASLADRVLDVGKWQGVSHLQSPPVSQCPQVELEIVPVSVTGDPGQYVFESELPAVASAASPPRQFTSKDFFALRVRAEGGDFDPHVAILQLTPDCGVHQFWPHGDTSDKSDLVPRDGKWYWLGSNFGLYPVGGDSKASVGLWRFATEADPSVHEDEFNWIDGVGAQQFRVFATDEHIEYGPLLTRGTRGVGQPANPLAHLIQNYSVGARGMSSAALPARYAISDLAVETVSTK